MELTFCAPCLFGLEGLAAAQLRRLGMEQVAAENGRVRFAGNEAALARANINLRFAERVLLEVGRFPAPTFDALYEGVKALELERFIPRDGQFPVKGYSLDSALHSIPDCQRIIKKAAADRLGAKYGCAHMPETGALYQLQFAIVKDEACLYLDTSGAGLHKRGYRPLQHAAPLRETLAAAMVELARYRGRGDFCDPFCGSGTIAIEAALMAKNRAPGLYRSFAAMNWTGIPARVWREAKDEARSKEFSGDYHIFASDIDGQAVALARQNAERAGVAPLIRFETADAAAFDRKTDAGCIVTNPPYGERLLEKQQAAQLCRAFGRAYAASSGWSAYVLSSLPEFESDFGRRADKKRKLYNGMIKCDLYMFSAKP